jgi:hypothetical protein
MNSNIERNSIDDNNQPEVLNFTPDFHDSRPASTLENRHVELMVQEIHELNQQIHNYLRITPTTMGLAATLIGGATALYTTNLSEFVHFGVLLVLPVVMSILLSYHFSVASEVAVLAEVRDRLSYRVNSALGRPVFVTRVASDLLRGSTPAWTQLAPVGFLMLVVMVLGIVNAWEINTKWLFAIQLISNILVAMSLVISFFHISKKRVLINAALDEIYTNANRPSSAAQQKDNLIHKLTVRRNRRH